MYDGSEVRVVFADDTMKPYFNAKQICELLGYADFCDAIRTHDEKVDVFYLQDIVKSYNELYKNAQGHTKFLNEGGMITLIMRSKHKNSKKTTLYIFYNQLKIQLILNSMLKKLSF